MGRKLLANGRGRWLALVASVVLAAGMIYAQQPKPHRAAAPTPAATATITQTIPALPPPAPDSGPHIATPEEAQKLAALAADAPIGAENFQFPLPPSIGPEDRLQVKTIWAARVISVLFPEIKTIFGWREDPLPWHPKGLAIDVMIPNHETPEGIELGNQIAGFA